MGGGRLLVIGIDAATPRLIQPWVERGDLPTFGRLMTSGVSGSVQSVPNMITPAAWTSFATGCNPGRHGVFFFTERLPGSYAERFISGGVRAEPPFWMLLSHNGVSCTVVNVPMTFPADPVRGVMISGMDAPRADAPGFTHPPELAEELQREFGQLLGPRTLSGAIGHLMLAGKVDAARAILEQRVKARTDLGRFLMERYPSDVFALVHTEVDGAQHYFWKYLDQRSPGYSSREAQRHGDSILRLYIEIDRSIAALQAAFGPANVMLMSDHGAGASPGVEDGVPWIRLVLEQMKLAVRRTGKSASSRFPKEAAAALYRAINPQLPLTVRRVVRRWLPGAGTVLKAATKYEYDWSRTRAFCMGAAGEVWLNVRGRDPLGIVEPGAEYERTRQQIRETFLALRDAQTGEPVIQAVQFREEIYSGPFADRAPDLFILFRDVVITKLALNGHILQMPRRVAAAPSEVKSGSHRPEGLLVLAGDGIRQGGRLEEARLIDVAPTILYWMSGTVPSRMDGNVLTGAFTPAHLARHPVHTSDGTIRENTKVPTDYTSEETAVLTERLRALGYL